MKKRKYFLKLFAFLLALVLPFAAWFVYIQCLPPQYSGSIMGTLHHKIPLIRDTPSPRLILAGGSSSPYATDCEYLANELGVNCINIGATAYLGIDLYISILEEYMQEGDIIVIGPEHSMLGRSADYSLVWAAAENDLAVWRVMPLRYLPGLAGNFYDHTTGKFNLYNSKDPDENLNSYEYRPDFGPLGDVIIYREALLASGYNTLDPIALGPDMLSDDFVTAMNKFYKKATAAGVQVFFAFAPVDELALTTAPSEWWALEARLRDELAMPVLGTMRDAIMAGEYFYDSNNHLTSEGAAIYSQALVQNLKQALA